MHTPHIPTHTYYFVLPLILQILSSSAHSDYDLALIFEIFSLASIWSDLQWILPAEAEAAIQADTFGKSALLDRYKCS